MNKYKISLITACYNIEEKRDVSFDKYLDSIRSQTIGYENIEHILVNDGSSDNTKDILDDLDKNFDNVRVFHLEKNSGSPGIPRNFAIKKATGKYLMFLDRDDYYLEDSMEILYNKIEEYDVDVVTSNFCVYDGNTLSKHVVENETEYTVDENSPNLYDAKLSDQSTIFNREYILRENIVYGSTSAAEDYFFHICSLIKSNKKIVVLNNVYTRVFSSDNSDSLSHKFDKKQLIGSIDTFRHLMNILKVENVNKEFIKDFYKESVLVSLGTYLRSNEPKNTKKIMFRKLKDYLNEFKDVRCDLNIHWRIMYILCVHNCFILLELSSIIIKSSFESSWFKMLFRNQSYA